MSTANQIVASRIVSGTLREYRFVTQSATDLTVTEANAGEKVIGISETDGVSSGDSVPVVMAGEAQITLGGTVTAGNLVKSDADGAAVELAGTGNENAGAIMLESGSSGEIKRCQLYTCEVDVS